MAKVLDLQPKKAADAKTVDDAKWIKKKLAASTQKSIINSDWTYNALKSFCEELINLYPQGKDIKMNNLTEYFESSNDYHDHPLLINPRPLLKYMQANRTSLERMLGIKDMTVNVTEPSKKLYRIFAVAKDDKEK